MNAVHLAFTVHNHQPVGNLEHVFVEAFDRSYTPFLEVMARYPEMPFGLHLSGTLIDWAREHRPGYLEQLGRLVTRGQVELLTGGYYEPILCALADEDKRGQIRKMTGGLEERFGARARGLWLAERVWEPGLVRPLAECGVDYTIVDDTHLLSTGMDPGEIHGYYLSEDQSATIALFPISKRLRYLVPFESPETTVAALRELAERAPGSLVTLADDGEKFGVWPDTHKLVFEEKWLERWVELLLAQRDWLGLTTCGRYLDRSPPRGLVYLPASSYEEMREWALPTTVQNDRREGRETDDPHGSGGSYPHATGFWRHFMVKYPEANHMHKRAAAVAARARLLGPSAAECGAQDHVWAAQCNCAYWHGVFGGLYLPHLRDAIYTHLIIAERLLDELDHDTRAEGETSTISTSIEDLDLDGRPEITLTGAELKLIVSPARGGGLLELDDRRRAINLANTLARRPEPYHRRLGGEAGEKGGARSIHDRLVTKEEGLEGLLAYDRTRRLLGVERLLAPASELTQLERGVARELADLPGVEYEHAIERSRSRVAVDLRAVTPLVGGGRLRLGKRWTIENRLPGLRLALQLELLDRDEPLAARLCSEWNIAMLAGNAPDRIYLAPGLAGGPESRMVSRGVLTARDRLGLRDGWRGFELWLDWDPPADVWRYPVETVSLSEAGVERVYQCSAVIPVWDLVLEPGETRTLELSCRLVPAPGAAAAG